MQIIKHETSGDIGRGLYDVCFFLFVGFFAASFFYFIRLVLPTNDFFLDSPAFFYKKLKQGHESSYSLPEEQQLVDDLLKDMYIIHQENVFQFVTNKFIKKQFSYNRAMSLALLSILPFLFCLAYHFSAAPGKASSPASTGNNLSPGSKSSGMNQKKTLNQNQEIDSQQKSKKTDEATKYKRGVIMDVSPMIINGYSTKIRRELSEKEKELLAKWEFEAFLPY